MFLFFEAVYISLIGDIFLPSTPLVLASDGRAHHLVLKVGWTKNILRYDRPFWGGLRACPPKI